MGVRLDHGGVEVTKGGEGWQSHGPAPDTTGFIYMLAGDTGASNTEPDAKGAPALSRS